MSDRRLWGRLWRDPRGLSGLALLGLLTLASLLGPVLSPYGSEPDLAARDRGPSWAHPFGTDQLGVDQLTRVLEGGRVSLLVGVGSALAATLIGAGLGLAAGARRGWLDALLARVADLFLIVPAFVVLVVLSLAFEEVGLAEIILILALLSWPPLFRLTRASALRTRELPYVQAARVAGAGVPRIVVRHLLPAAMPEISAFAALAAGAAILAESALSFLSLGIDPDAATSWGNLMIGAQDTIEDQPWLTLFPGGCVLLTVLALALLGDALRDLLEPGSARRPRPLRRTL